MVVTRRLQTVPVSTHSIGSTAAVLDQQRRTEDTTVRPVTRPIRSPQSAQEASPSEPTIDSRDASRLSCIGDAPTLSCSRPRSSRTFPWRSHPSASAQTPTDLLHPCANPGHLSGVYRSAPSGAQMCVEGHGGLPRTASRSVRGVSRAIAAKGARLLLRSVSMAGGEASSAVASTRPGH